MKHFLKESDFAPRDLGEVFALAREFKRQRGRSPSAVLGGKTWAMIFSKSSTRTRVSFEVAIRELGGHVIFLNRSDIQLGRGESIEDTARVLSRFVHGLIVRTHEHHEVERLAAVNGVPVINALTDFLHPCQIYADAFTAAERWAGPDGDYLAALKGRKIAFLGDTCFNMANSWILGASVFGMKLSLAGPKNRAPGKKIRALLEAEGRSLDFQFTTDPHAAVAGADLVYTDVWTSMGQEAKAKKRTTAMRRYAVTAKLFAAAKPDALFMHCLPAHPGEEVAQEVLDNPRCIVFDETENRLHVQKAILTVLAQSSRKAPL
jgi:ornithine carbamoyltransferase